MKVNHRNPAADAYSKSRNALRVLPENESLFGEALVVAREPVFQYNVAFGFSNLRLTENIVGSGSKTASGGKIRISTGTTASSSYQIESAEVGQYSPGFGAELGIGFRLVRAPTGNEFAQWGGISATGNDGFYFEENSTEILAVRKKAGSVAESVPRSQWNIDRLDGTGGDFNASEIDVDTLSGYIWQVDFTWYGYGIIVYGIVRGLPDAISIQHFIPCHAIQVDGDVSIEEPNLQIFAKVDNGGDSTDLQGDVGGIQYAIVGSSTGQRKRSVADYRRSVSLSAGVRTPLIAFQRKPGFLNRAILAESLLVTAATSDILIEIFVNGTISGGTWTNPTGHDADEVSVEAKLNATGYTPGIKVYTGIAFAGQANKPGAATPVNIDAVLPVGSAFTLCGTALDGSATAGTVLFSVTDGW